MTTLVVTAVEAEADAFRAGLSGIDPELLTVAAVGVGPAAAAAGTARLLALAEGRGSAYTRVVSVGIGGGFADRTELGGLVVAARSIIADLGADAPDGFIPIDELGFGSAITTADAALLAELVAALPGAEIGDILTVSTVTGTAAGTAEVRRRWPDAVAEAMEGGGVAAAAAGAGIAFGELRAISNAIGPRDRGSWRIGAALSALTSAAAGWGHTVGR
ncbi:futalosine hydrolase [Allocatelliglobosispora scoriae]|uniref:Futalosine hydrolase n=1 Tax=Allocatelliglobosispora scoriae TaxID=643052 RepID=A0A841BQJ7_9ACTN|nr:futalosine hydrolase [Allocatelliglobosispora scoriae]MBB5871337.1 futalosine hydrolase [Allocatelliglobosispora scoriae]